MRPGQAHGLRPVGFLYHSPLTTHQLGVLFWTIPQAHFRSGGGVPDNPLAPGKLPPRRGQVPAVRAEGHIPDPAGGAFQGESLLAGGGIPDLDGPVSARRGEPPAVRAVSHRVDGGGVAAEGEEPPARLHVPDHQRLIFARPAPSPPTPPQRDPLY